MLKISDNFHFSFSNYTNFKCTYFFANEITFAIYGTHLWPLSVHSQLKLVSHEVISCMYMCMYLAAIRYQPFSFWWTILCTLTQLVWNGSCTSFPENRYDHSNKCRPRRNSFYAAFRRGFHCLPNSLRVGIRNVKG